MRSVTRRRDTSETSASAAVKTPRAGLAPPGRGPLSGLVVKSLLLVAGVAVGILIARSLSSGSSPPQTPAQGAITQRSLNVVVQGLCSAQTSVANGDLAAARVSFLNQSHVFLHSLAASVEARDRDAATNLLLSMFRVESLLSLPIGQTTIPTPSPSQDPPVEVVASLLMAIRQAATVLGLNAPGC